VKKREVIEACIAWICASVCGVFKGQSDYSSDFSDISSMMMQLGPLLLSLLSLILYCQERVNITKNELVAIELVDNNLEDMK
jgi:hypothetical protein